MEAKNKYTKSDVVKLLADKQAELLSSGEDRYPRRGDFSDAEVEAVKSHFGPWPRALEASGIKPPREGDRTERNRERRRRAKLRRKENENNDRQ